MGRDSATSTATAHSSCFNPRARMGRDMNLMVINTQNQKFQPTRPHGARRSSSTPTTEVSSFNPRARMGRDIRPREQLQPNICFNPRARMGRDLLRSWNA